MQREGRGRAVYEGRDRAERRAKIAVVLRGERCYVPAALAAAVRLGVVVRPNVPTTAVVPQSVVVCGNHFGLGADAGRRAQHGCRHRAPDGEQDGKQQQQPDAGVLHRESA